MRPFEPPKKPRAPAPKPAPMPAQKPAPTPGVGDDISASLIERGGGEDGGLWSVRYWIFGVAALAIIGAVSVVFVVLLYLPFVPKDASPPPAASPPPSPLAPLAVGMQYVEQVSFSLQLVGPAARRRLDIVNSGGFAWQESSFKAALRQQMPAGVAAEHIELVYAEPIVSGTVRIVPPVESADVKQVFEKASFEAGLEVDTGFDVTAVTSDVGAIAWPAPSPPPQPPLSPPTSPPSPGLPPRPPPAPPPPPFSPMSCPADVPPAGEFCAGSGFSCGYNKQCCDLTGCQNLTTAICSGNRRWTVNIETVVACPPAAPPSPPHLPSPPSSPPTPPLPPTSPPANPPSPPPPTPPPSKPPSPPPPSAPPSPKPSPPPAPPQPPAYPFYPPLLATKLETGCGEYVVQLERSVTTDGASAGKQVAYTKAASGVCDTVPNPTYAPTWPLVQLNDPGQLVATDADTGGITFTVFSHTDQKVYLRANGCVLYQYSGNTASSPYQAISAVWPVLALDGTFTPRCRARRRRPTRRAHPCRRRPPCRRCATTRASASATTPMWRSG